MKFRVHAQRHLIQDGAVEIEADSLGEALAKATGGSGDFPDAKWSEPRFHHTVPGDVEELAAGPNDPDEEDDEEDDEDGEDEESDETEDEGKVAA